MNRYGCVLAMLILAAAAGGCGSDAEIEEAEPVSLEWDLSSLPLAEVVTGWQPEDPVIDTVMFDNVGKVVFTIDDRTFTAKGNIHDVTVTSSSDWIELVQVDYVPMTVEEAAVTLQELDMPVPDHVIASWVRSTKGTRGQDTPPFPEIELDQTGYTDAAIGVRTRYSFNDDHPVIVSAVFVWSELIFELLTYKYGGGEYLEPGT